MDTKEIQSPGRREFIKLSALGFAGVIATPGIVPCSDYGPNLSRHPVNAPGAAMYPDQATDQKMISHANPASRPFPGILTGRQKKAGIALVGLGYYSSELLAPALQETSVAYLAGIVTGTMDNEKLWTEKYNIPKRNIYNYQNFDEIAGNRDIDIIYIVLPNSMHKEFTIRAARAGKHVICEKPMALNVQECIEMIEECRKNNVGLSIGYRMHYEPYTQEIMRLGQEKVFGNVLHISCGAAFRFDNFDNWRWDKKMGGGAMMDMGVYCLQAARYVTGEEPLRVTAQTFVTRPGRYQGVDEATTFQLEFPGGTLASLDTGFHANINHLYVSAEKGSFELRPFQAYSGIAGRTSKGEMDFPAVNQQAVQMDENAMDMMAGRPVRTPGEEGLRDMVVVDAIFNSIRTGKPVNLA
jgi:glucose-fructose oxidoreductase